MKNIYLAQPTNMLSGTVYLPYTVGAIAAYSWQFAEIRSNYNLKEFLLFEGSHRRSHCQNGRSVSCIKSKPPAELEVLTYLINSATFIVLSYRFPYHTLLWA